MKYYMGVDAGGTKTACVVGDSDGNILGSGKAGCGSHQMVGLEQAVEAYEKACSEALEKAGLNGDDILFGTFCLGGADLSQDFEMLTPAVEAIKVAQKINVKNDIMAVLRSGLSRSWGVGVICGTGNNAAGIALDGRESGYAAISWKSGDYGSGGGWLGQEAFRKAMRDWDGRGRKTSMKEKILKFMNVSDMNTLLAGAYNETLKHEFAALTPLVFDAAYEGDQVAQDIIIEAGHHIGVSAANLIRKLDLCDKPVEVVLGGSLFEGKGPLFIEAVKLEVHRAAPEAVFVVPEFKPVIGAWLLAFESGGIEADKSLYDTIKSTLPDDLKINKNRE